MRTDEVPQEGMDYRGRDQLAKLMYAVGKDGSFEGIPSAGWEAENIATRDAWAGVEEDLTQTIADIRAGRVSPLAYWMKKRLMDVTLLARYAGRWVWTVKRHLQQKHFNKLSQKALEGYARVLEVSVEELKSLPADSA